MDTITLTDKLIAEQNEFINAFLDDYPSFKSYDEVEHSLRAVLHVLRDRLPVQESFHLLAQLPVFLKLSFIEGWKYREKPLRIETIGAFRTAVQEELLALGDRDVDPRISPEKIRNILNALKQYISEGEIRHIVGSIPPELQSLFSEDGEDR